MCSRAEVLQSLWLPTSSADSMLCTLQMEAWQHIKPLAWLDWLLKMPSWKVCTHDSPLAIYLCAAAASVTVTHNGEALALPS